MRFPLSLTRSMTAYLMRQKLAGRKRFPMVLMLEPLHECNLKCTGCGRIREYADTAHERLSVEECLAAADECGAPIISVCGGEPLIHPEIDELVERLVERKKHVYLCTNGTLLAKKIELFRPSSRIFINVHLDGMEATHDAITGRKGVFAKAVDGIQAAKKAGFLVYTNTTVYRQTDIHELAVLFQYLTELGVDGFMVSPAYGYEAVTAEGPGASDIFMKREEIHVKFQEARRLLATFKLVTSPLYLDFLCGGRELPCAAWANPTFNVRGWKGPCYLVTDRHYARFADLLRETEWDRLGPGGDRRCEHCLVHCGFEPAAVLSTEKTLRDVLKMAFWQMT
ncbi:MAG: adenosyl-hopene transferase HpnH [Thermoguttaceae bacterium]